MNAIWSFLQQYGWFIGVPLLFLIVVAYVFRPSARKRYQRDGEIPFADQPPKGSRK